MSEYREAENRLHNRALSRECTYCRKVVFSQDENQTRINRSTTQFTPPPRSVFRLIAFRSQNRKFR